MMEKTVEIELADGQKETVTLRRLLRRERRDLNKMIAPADINTQNPGYKVNYEKWEDYREKYITITVKTPEKFKQLKEVQELPDVSFNALFTVAQEVNGELSQDKTEKKSEPQSSEV